MVRSVIIRALRAAFLALSPVLLGATAWAEPQHGIAMYGAPALPEGFAHLPYANPDAPKGGRIRMGESGSFDSLNPWILKGRAAQGISAYVTESLMGRSYDEPFTLYGLLAESVETDEARSWVEFTLRESARFSDGSPVTVEDVMWSYETLGTQGHPRYQNAWRKVAKMEQTGPRSLRLTFSEPDRELALLMGMRPVLKKAQWDGKTFAEETLTTPVGSGPYLIDRVEQGKYISLRRNPDWWGKDLGFNRGQHNFDEIRYDYFGDGGVVFEAFKGGEIDTWRETNAAKWARDFDFPAVQDGRVVKSEIPHQRPSGIQGLVMNTRKPVFADWRVREAMMLAFNFEFINATLNDGSEPRITSFFSNSVLGMQPGAAQGKVAELLAPFAADLLPGVIDGYELPSSDGSELNRGNTRKAIKLLEEAGWQVDKDGVLKNADGTPFTFEIVLQQGAAETSSVVDIYVEGLSRLGIFPKVTNIDDAQYTARTNSYDFDMAWYVRALSLSPGNEQMLYWGARGVAEPGSRNWMGMNVPAAEAMVTAMVSARETEDFVAATQALDRILTAGRYVIPGWYSRVSRLAHIRELHFPERLPLYGDWPGFQPDVWWYEEAQ
ncbi:extracellular solute-binding protein [Sedimentimonas flavescens]|uniref:extracellular solute-binding protein n=1 Tax=Sedimentimonas flavescens TaxID=2851012 RepID=UPI0021A4F633|nr:extracellular solute-binding protein [Sedimentimonas flavescens]MCT2538378.1 extracellular solute-binding protein [Sedimentimonas flavescens]